MVRDNYLGGGFIEGWGTERRTNDGSSSGSLDERGEWTRWSQRDGVRSGEVRSEGRRQLPWGSSRVDWYYDRTGGRLLKSGVRPGERAESVKWVSPHLPIPLLFPEGLLGEGVDRTTPTTEDGKEVHRRTQWDTLRGGVPHSGVGRRDGSPMSPLP